MTDSNPSPALNLPRPTEAELAILHVLWTHGASTVRDVHSALDTATGYTTILKLLQIMTEKGLVQRDEGQRAHVYSPRQPQEHTQRQLVGDLVQRAFGGSAMGMMMQLLNSRPATPDEIAELRRILDEHKSGSENGGRP